MATMRLVPSTYAVSNSNYVTVSNAANMYDNVDSTTHGTFTHNRASTSNTYYAYLRGFNFDDLPSNAVVSGWTVKIKASATGHTTSTSSSYYMSLVNGTTQIGSTSADGRLSTTVTTFTFAEGSLDWADLVDYGSSFGIRIPLRRASQNTADVVSVYGAEIEVTYTLPVYHDVTLTNTTSATAAVSDTHPIEGDDVVVSIDTLANITVTDNGTDVTSQFVRAQDATVEQVPDATIDTEFSDSGGAFYISSSSSTTDYLEYACGHSAESPGTATSTNTYVKGNASGNTTTGTAIYSFDFSEIPASATITSVEVRAYCARENSTVDSTHVCRAAVYSGSTIKGAQQDVSGTDYHIHTMSNVGTWTWSELQSAKFHFTLGYYGGRIAGITFEVSYEVDGYGYTIANVTADHVIVVSSASAGPKLYVKQAGAWVQVTAAYRKVGGAWQQVALDEAFSSGTRYRRPAWAGTPGTSSWRLWRPTPGSRP